MNFNTGFTVVVRTNKYNIGKNTVDESIVKEDLELNFNFDTATKFLLRFYDDGFDVDSYKLLFKRDSCNRVEGITLFKDNYLYIVTNTNQLINDVLRGYKYIITIDKVIDIMEFDFKVAEDLVEEE